MSPLHAITYACLPRVHLERLAPIRAWRAVKALEQGDMLWLGWPEHTLGVAELLYPLPGSELFERREGHWFAFKRKLPCFTVPDFAGARPLADWLFPAPVTLPAVPTESRPAVCITLVADTQPRQATALICTLAELNDWLETVPTGRFSSLQALRHGEQALLLGDELPPLPGAERYWGTRILTPLGFRYEPLLPEATLVNIVDLAAKQSLLFRHSGIELVDRGLAQPLRRAAVKLALAPLAENQ